MAQGKRIIRSVSLSPAADRILQRLTREKYDGNASAAVCDSLALMYQRHTQVAKREQGGHENGKED